MISGIRKPIRRGLWLLCLSVAASQAGTQERPTCCGADGNEPGCLRVQLVGSSEPVDLERRIRLADRRQHTGIRRLELTQGLTGRLARTLLGTRELLRERHLHVDLCGLDLL